MNMFSRSFIYQYTIFFLVDQSYEIIHLNFPYLTKITSRYTSLEISNDSRKIVLEPTENEKHK